MRRRIDDVTITEVVFYGVFVAHVIGSLAGVI
jgi:hypothetical protein